MPNSILKSLVLATLLLGSTAFADPTETGVPERVQAFSSSEYTAIGPMLFGSGSNALSFIRLINRSGSTAQFSMRIVGDTTGTDYLGGDVYTISVPNHAAPQYSILDLRTAIQGALGRDIAPLSGDSGVIIYLKTDQVGKDVAFQHVAYNGNTGFFENLSVCSFTTDTNMGVTNHALSNLHTSRLSGYPSHIELVNPDNVSRIARGRVYDARTGASIGTFTLPIAANSSAGNELPAVESAMNFNPTSSQLHVNIEFESADSSAYTSIPEHSVVHSASGATFNMTAACPIVPRAADSSSCSTANTSGGQTSCAPVTVADTLTDAFTTGQQSTISLASLTANDVNASGATLDDVTTPRSPNLQGAANGTLLRSGSSILYMPATSGTVQFQYRISTSSGLSDYATVTLTVGGGVPVAVDDKLADTFAVGRQSTIALTTLTANDRNSAGATIADVTTPRDSTGAANGTITISGSNLLYMPIAAGLVQFQYRIRTISGLSDYATVVLVVGSNGPVAVADTLTQACTVNQACTILFTTLTANDLNATGASLLDFTGLSGGTLIRNGNDLTFTAARTGTATFQYKIQTAAGTSDFATVTVAVTGSTLPVAVSDTLTQTCTANVACTISLSSLTANDTNASGASVDQFTAPLTNGSINGTLAQSGNDLVLTATRSGVVTFQYRIRTATGTSDFATVTVTVSAGVPRAVNDTLSQTCRANQACAILFSTLTANDIDASGASLADWSGPSTGGTINGTVTRSGNDLVLTAVSGGTVTFQYKIQTSAGTSNFATVTVTVISTPVAVADTLTQSCTTGQACTIALTTLTANDTSASGATLADWSSPTTDGSTNGTLTRSGDNLVLTAARTGTVTFTYKIQTSAGISNAATVTVQAGAVPRVSTSSTQIPTINCITGVPCSIYYEFLTAADSEATGANIADLGSPTTGGSLNGTLTRSGNDLILTATRAGTVSLQYSLQNTVGTSGLGTKSITVADAASFTGVTKSKAISQTCRLNQQCTIALTTYTAGDTLPSNLQYVSAACYSGCVGSATSGGSAVVVGTNTVVITPNRTGTILISYSFAGRNPSTGGTNFSNTSAIKLTVTN